jgi:hypothetical protein
LTKLAKIELDHEVKPKASIISNEEQQKLLNGYIEVAREDWIKLIDGDIIRYLRKDGIFRKGGLIKNSWIGTSGRNKDRNCIQMAPLISKYNNNNNNNNSWTICHDDIDKIWKKKRLTLEIPQEGSKMAILEEKIEFLTRTTEQQKIDLLKLKNEQTRIINLIKKLHNIKTK